MVIDTGRPLRGGKRHGRPVRGAIYARFSSRFQHSIDDQVRDCREWAERNGVDVRFVFTDRAVTGKSSRRSGLHRLQTALENDEVDVVIIFTTNRLYRKMYQSLAFVEEEIVDRRKRCVSVRSGIDTADSEDWRQRLQLHALIDEFVVQTIAKHVHAAHEGLLLRTRVFGTVTFGYTGEIIERVQTRLGQPARRLIVDPADPRDPVRAAAEEPGLVAGAAQGDCEPDGLFRRDRPGDAPGVVRGPRRADARSSVAQRQDQHERRAGQEDGRDGHR